MEYSNLKPSPSRVQGQQNQIFVVISNCPERVGRHGVGTGANLSCNQTAHDRQQRCTGADSDNVKVLPEHFFSLSILSQGMI